MTDHNPSAGNAPARPAEAPAPVTDFENESVNGLALVCESIFRDTVNKVEQLRERQEAYRETLPTEPAEKLEAIRQIWRHDDYFAKGGMREAEAIAFALESMVKPVIPRTSRKSGTRCTGSLRG